MGLFFWENVLFWAVVVLAQVSMEVPAESHIEIPIWAESVPDEAIVHEEEEADRQK